MTLGGNKKQVDKIERAEILKEAISSALKEARRHLKKGDMLLLWLDLLTALGNFAELQGVKATESGELSEESEEEWKEEVLRSLEDAREAAEKGEPWEIWRELEETLYAMIGLIEARAVAIERKFRGGKGMNLEEVR